MANENGSHVRLQYMQEQLDEAETRCKCLQKELDQMKQQYSGKNEIDRKKGNVSLKSKTFSCGCPVESVDSNKTVKKTKCNCLNDKLVDTSTSANLNDKCKKCGTCREQKKKDFSIEARYADPKKCQESIQNILSGITESVNQIADMNFDTPRKQTASCGCKVTELEEGWIIGPDGVRIGPDGSRIGPDGIRIFPDGSRMGPDGIRIFPDGSRMGPDGVRIGLDGKIIDDLATIEKYGGKGRRGSKQGSITSSMRRRRNALKKRQGRGGGAGILSTKVLFQKSSDKLTCPSDIECRPMWDCMDYCRDPCGRLSTIKEGGKRRSGSSCLKSYQLPTICSKLRQVDPNYFCRFNFCSIPFVASGSVSPSHNLGINIQQVLSLIKTRQPISGISPTLAHNMGLAATRGSFAGVTGPISSLLTQMSSQVPSNKQTCPMLYRAVNNNYPCSMSPTICGSPRICGSPIISPRIGSMLPVQSPGPCPINNEDVMKRVRCEWDQPIPQSNIQNRCVCYPRKSSKSSHMGSGETLPNFLKNYYSNTNTSYSRRRSSMQNMQTNKMSHTHSKNNTQIFDLSKMHNTEYDEDLPGKIRKLRDVLVTLHNDFSYLNNKFNILQTKVDNSRVHDKVALKQLQETEYELQKKEKEIGVVVSLFKKILTLKEQGLPNQTIKKSSISSVDQSSSREISSQESNVSTHLTKLLQKVKSVQGSLKC